MTGIPLAVTLAASLASPSVPCDAPPEAPFPSPPPSHERSGEERRATATPAGTRLTLAWVLTQLIPSPELELFVSPEYLAIDERLSQRFGLRAGVRAHFPLILVPKGHP